MFKHIHIKGSPFRIRNLPNKTRCFSASAFSLSNRPTLLSILPNKRTINRLLFDNDSRLAYKKMLAILQSVYSNLDNPDNIRIPSYTKGNDLMTCKSLLSTIRNITNTTNKHLVDLENELVEQSAELGNNDAISILAFETIQDSKSSKEDYQYANNLITELSNLNHPLTFKLAGDLAFNKNFYEQAENYWLQFLKFENDTILASQVYNKLGMYYFNYLKPKADLTKAKLMFEKSIKFGELDNFIIQSHYYLGQLYSITDPQLSKYHLEVSASKGLKESFPSLGFLELNVFQNFSKSLEWFKLGVESNNDLTCLIGQFDCYIALNENVNATNILGKLINIQDKIIKVSKLNKSVPIEFESLMATNKSVLDIFFKTRKSFIKGLEQNIA